MMDIAALLERARRLPVTYASGSMSAASEGLMKRTTVHLPADLRARAKRCARERGITLAELVRAALRREVREGRADDPLFRPMRGYRRRPGVPTDLSVNHEAFLDGGA